MRALLGVTTCKGSLTHYLFSNWYQPFIMPIFFMNPDLGIKTDIVYFETGFLENGSLIVKVKVIHCCTQNE